MTSPLSLLSIGFCYYFLLQVCVASESGSGIVEGYDLGILASISTSYRAETGSASHEKHIPEERNSFAIKSDNFHAESTANSHKTNTTYIHHYRTWPIYESFNLGYRTLCTCYMPFITNINVHVWSGSSNTWAYEQDMNMLRHDVMKSS